MPKTLYILLFLLLTGTFASNSALAQGGRLWGVTLEGGKDGAGVIFRTNADGSNYTVVKEFEVVNHGWHPRYTTLTKASNGKLYGVTSQGGKHNDGVLFEFDPVTGSYERKADFEYVSRGANPNGSLVEAPNGKLYGTTTKGGDPYGWGVIFEFDPATGVFEKKVDLAYQTGTNPNDGMVLGNNGKLYGMTEQGGATNDGVIFEFDLQTGEYSKLVDLSSTTTGARPMGTLTLASSGIFYGLTKTGGTNGGGVLFSFDPATHQLTRKVDFSFQQTGAYPLGSLVEGADGKLYGMTSDGGAYSGLQGYYGVIFSYDPNAPGINGGFEKKLDFGYYFTGSNPFGSLIRASNGKFYGMNSNGGLGGGVDQVGVLFEYTPESGLVAKHYFQWKDGGTPYGSLTELNGKLYGLTMIGGVEYAGTLFEYDLTTNVYKNHIDLAYAPGGFNPRVRLTPMNSKLFGISSGGLYGGGTIFEYDTATSEFSKRFDFSLSHDQMAHPFSDMVVAPNGKLYGVTSHSGVVNSNGTFFEFDPVSGAVTKKTDLKDAGVTGPPRKLLLVNGKIYGTAAYGGAHGEGILFEYDPLLDQITKRIEFKSSSTVGGEPVGLLIEGANGMFYGLTKKGGANNAGILYQFNPSTGAHEKKLDLNDLKNIGGPMADVYESLTYGSDGKLYGMAGGGGDNSVGFVFRFDPLSNNLVKVHDFSWDTGAFPNGGDLTLTPDGKLYGMTSYLGQGSDKGVMFKFNPSNNEYTVTHRFDADGGYNSAWSELTYVPSPIVLSVEDSDDRKLKPYPVPAENTLYLREVEGEVKDVRIVNELSQHEALPFSKTGNTYEINIQGLRSGFYILQVSAGNKIQKVKFIKK